MSSTTLPIPEIGVRQNGSCPAAVCPLREAIATLVDTVTAITQRIHAVAIELFYRISSDIVVASNHFMIALPWNRWKYYSDLKDLDHGVLFLSALPLKNNIGQIVRDLNSVAEVKGVKNQDENGQKKVAFLSIVEAQETWGGWIYKPALQAPVPGKLSREQLVHIDGCSIDNLHISTRDFSPVSPENIARGVEFIERSVRDGVPICTHCRAGIGRSAMTIVAYLMKNEWPAMRRYAERKNRALSDNPTFDEKFDITVSYLQEQRTQIAVGGQGKENIRLCLAGITVEYSETG